MKRSGRAYVDARSIGAMVAAHNRKKPASVRELPFFYIFNPSTVDPDRHIVLRLAGDGTGVTSDTFTVVYNKAKVHYLVSIEVMF